MDDRRLTDRNATERYTSPKRRGFRRWAIGGMLGLALAAMLLGGTAFAQSDSGGTDTTDSFMDRLAEKLGITSSDLETAIQETRESYIDDAVAEGRLTEKQGADLKERMESGSGFFDMVPGRHAFGFGRPAFSVFDIGLDTIASELGMTTDELRDELASGSTLSDVITEHGATVEDIAAALVADAEAELDEAVANGNLTQEQADRMLTNLPERLTRMIERGLPADCQRWFDGDTHSNDADGADETSNQV